jgi:hypothetical protein
MNTTACARLALLCTLALGACSSSEEHSDSTAASTTGAVVTGTVVDRATGAPIEGARVRFPDGHETKTDAAGRFESDEMALGLQGEVTATAGERRGVVVLRPLAAGRLEVVIHTGA